MFKCALNMILILVLHRKAFNEILSRIRYLSENPFKGNYQCILYEKKQNIFMNLRII